MESLSRANRRRRYQGTDLAKLLLALAIPLFLLYLRIVLATIPREAHVTPEQTRGLVRAADVALAIFFPVQLLCAGYVQKTLELRGGIVRRIIQCCLVLLACLCCSVIGAIAFEAFGFELFLRTLAIRR